ncbi:MAG TPA: DUF58 domain-containing protein [Myxococcota bacterium]|nr:DUF58 domain-containing protein [Myxococcota bacterium]HQK50020.1 DUF58 domain-containing protein [Myxococcota bacterium]
MPPLPEVLLGEEARQALAGAVFRPRMVAGGIRGGVHLASHLGQSREFSDLKPYSFGDDLRHLDWKVLARTDRAYVRRYLDETNLSAWLVLDASGSMGEAPGGVSKYRHGAGLLAALAWVLLQQGDEVAATVCAEGRLAHLPPRSVPSHWRDLNSLWVGTRPGGGTDLVPALREVVVRARRRGIVVIASDLLTAREPVMDSLRALAARGHAVHLLHVLTPEERTFPWQGTAVFQSPETRGTALMDARALRRSYLQAMQAFLQDWQRACHESRIRYLSVPMTRAAWKEALEVIQSSGTEPGVGGGPGAPVPGPRASTPRRAL